MGYSIVHILTNVGKFVSCNILTHQSLARCINYTVKYQNRVRRLKWQGKEGWFPCGSLLSDWISSGVIRALESVLLLAAVCDGAAWLYTEASWYRAGPLSPCKHTPPTSQASSKSKHEISSHSDHARILAYFT